jgi:hypothetical protein
MTQNKSKKNKRYQIENQPVFYIAFTLFLMSFGLIFYGLTQGGKTEIDEGKKVEARENTNGNLDVSVQEYFKTSESSTYQADDEFIKDDPFAELCAPVSGDGIPSVHSNTVCLR